MTGRRRSNISQQTRNVIRLWNIVNQSTEERQNAHEECRVSMGRLWASQAEEQKEKARETNGLGIRYRQAQGRDQLRNNLRRDASGINLNRAAFVYDCIIDYRSHPFVRIGQMDVVCEHCGALKFAGERLDCAALMTKWNCHYWLRHMSHCVLCFPSRHHNHDIF